MQNSCIYSALTMEIKVLHLNIMIYMHYMLNLKCLIFHSKLFKVRLTSVVGQMVQFLQTSDAWQMLAALNVTSLFKVIHRSNEYYDSNSLLFVFYRIKTSTVTSCVMCYLPKNVLNRLLQLLKKPYDLTEWYTNDSPIVPNSHHLI